MKIQTKKTVVTTGTYHIICIYEPKRREPQEGGFFVGPLCGGFVSVGRLHRGGGGVSLSAGHSISGK